MSGERFYATLPVITDFEAITQAESYAALPDDWHVALCDVRNSTAAVAAGGLFLAAKAFKARANQYISHTGI